MKKLMLGLAILLASCSSTEDQLNSIKKQVESGDYDSALSSLHELEKTNRNNAEFDKSRDELMMKINDGRYAKMKSNRKDNIFMDFKLGMTPDQFISHSNELITEKKLSDLNIFDLYVIKLPGYETEFNVSGYSCNAIILKPDFDISNLDRIEIIVLGNSADKSEEKVIQDLSAMFRKKYGEPKTIPSFYTPEETENIKYYFEDANQAIFISEVAGYVGITFEDLIVKYEKSKS